MVGYPLAVHGTVPVFVTVTTPVIVPAAPWPCPGDPVMCVQPAEETDVDVVVDAAVVDVVVEGGDTDAAECVVVVTFFGVLGLLLHAASTTAAPATSASAHRRRVTLRSPRAAPSRGTAGTARPARRACRPLPPRRRAPR